MGPKGTYMEQEISSMRVNLTTGEVSNVLGSPGDALRTVMRPDGSTALEWRSGSLRFSSDSADCEMIL